MYDELGFVFIVTCYPVVGIKRNVFYGMKNRDKAMACALMNVLIYDRVVFNVYRPDRTYTRTVIEKTREDTKEC